MNDIDLPDEEGYWLKQAQGSYTECKDMPDRLKSSIEFAKQMVEIEPQCIQYFHDNVLSDSTLMLYVVERNGMLLRYAKDGLALQPDFMYAAVQPNIYREVCPDALLIMDETARAAYKIVKNTSMLLLPQIIGLDKFVSVLTQLKEITIDRNFLSNNIEQLNKKNQEVVMNYLKLSKEEYLKLKKYYHDSPISNLLGKVYRKYEAEDIAEKTLHCMDSNPIVDEETKSMLKRIF